MKVKTEYNMIFIMILVCLILNLILSCIIFQVVSKITRGFTDKALKRLEKIQSGDLSFSLGEYDVAGMCLPRQLKILLEIADHSHLFYGSDYPYTPEAGCIMLAEDLDKTEILTEELRKDIYYNNALKLFPRLIK